jgi:predicted Zn-dependent protease
LIAAHDGDPAALTTEQHSLALLGIVDARMAQGKMRDAEVAYDALARLAPNALPTRVVSAQIQMAKGNVSDAVAGLQRLVLAQPGYAPARLLLARGLLLQGNLYQAEVQLQAVLQAVPGHPGATALLDQIHHRIASGSSGDRGGAGPATAAGQPFAMARNPAVLNNQAWEYFQRGDLRAEELARQAHELAPNHPEIADTYGWILLRLRHDHQRALPLLEAAAKGAPRNPEIQYHYASALAASGRRVEAGSILKATLASGAAFASRQEAQSLFQSVAAQRP